MEEKNKVFYKVVSKDRTSLVAHNIPKISKYYKTGTIVKAVNETYGLFCFKTKQQAVAYANLFVGVLWLYL